MSNDWAVFRLGSELEEGDDDGCEMIREFQAEDFDDAWSHAIECMRTQFGAVWDDDSKWQLSQSEDHTHIGPRGGMRKFERLAAEPPRGFMIALAADDAENTYYLIHGNLGELVEDEPALLEPE